MTVAAKVLVHLFLPIHALMSNSTPVCTTGADTRIELAVNFISIWGNGQTDQLGELTTPDAIYRDTPNLHDYVGAEIADYFNHVHGWSENTRISIRSVAATPCGALVEWTVSGIQARPIGNRMPWASNRPWQFDGVTVLSFHGERISQAVDYYDVATFMGQIGFTFLPPEPETLSQEMPLPD